VGKRNKKRIGFPLSKKGGGAAPRSMSSYKLSEPGGGGVRPRKDFEAAGEKRSPEKNRATVCVSERDIISLETSEES